ncbi:MAG: class I SAM-dependent methyltransferase [Actinomycetota bacterium]
MTDQPSGANRDAANRHRRRQYAAEAATYDRDADRSERWLLGTDHRPWACSRAAGRTLEVAIGTGLNLPHYPHGVHLTGIDLTPEMLAVARRRSSDLGARVTLTEGDAQALPFRDAAFDTVLCTYAMCSVPDERATVLEMKRVLKPGGRLILVDHIRSSVPPLYWLQRLMELAPSRNRDELTRRPRRHAEAVGFTIEESDRLRAGVVERLVARKRDAQE